MPQVGYETKTPVFERAKTIYALDRSVTVIGISFEYIAQLYIFSLFI
jgi:hypothetical protein